MARERTPRERLSRRIAWGVAVVAAVAVGAMFINDWLLRPSRGAMRSALIWLDGRPIPMSVNIDHFGGFAPFRSDSVMTLPEPGQPGRPAGEVVAIDPPFHLAVRTSTGEIETIRPDHPASLNSVQTEGWQFNDAGTSLIIVSAPSQRDEAATEYRPETVWDSGMVLGHIALFIAIMIVVGGAGWLYGWFMTMPLRFVRDGHCASCGYDLRGVPDAGCPECGWGRDGGATATEG